MTHPLVKARGKAAFIKDYSVDFWIRGRVRLEPGFLSLRERPGEVGWGVLVPLTEKEWRSISGHEAAYSLSDLTVHLRDDAAINAKGLVTHLSLLETPVIPSARYARKLVKAAKHYSLPDEVLEYYQRMQKQGSKKSLLISPLFPLIRKLIPHLGVKRAFYTAVIGVPCLVVVLVLALVWLVL